VQLPGHCGGTPIAKDGPWWAAARFTIAPNALTELTTLSTLSVWSDALADIGGNYSKEEHNDGGN
jgi:hypothetical protein